MLRLLHTADVHLGARHTDLGERAAVLRERQFHCFPRHDRPRRGREGRSGADRRRSVRLQYPAAPLGGTRGRGTRTSAKASIRTVIIPGTHDLYDGASIFRSYDLAAMARTTSEWIVVLTPEQPNVWLPTLDAVVHGRVFNTKRGPKSPLEGFDARADRRATWRIGMVHGALAIPGKTDGDEVVFREDEIAKTGLDYLALGHWHSAIEGRAGNVTYAYSGAPEPVAVDQDGAGQVLLVTLEERGGRHLVSIVPKRVGQTRSEKLELDVSAIASQPILLNTIGRHADSNLVLDVRLTGLFPDTLDVDMDEVERALAPSFLRLRIRDVSIPAMPEGNMPPPDTVIGAFVRNVETQIAELEKIKPGSRTAPAAAAGETAPVDLPDRRPPTGLRSKTRPKS